MKSNPLVQFYDRLTPDERFRLVLEAEARGDHDEVRRLAEACPRKTYVIADRRYRELIESSRLAALFFMFLWARAAHGYRLAEVAADAHRQWRRVLAEGLIAGVNIGWQAGGRNGGLFAIEGRGPTPVEAAQVVLLSADGDPMGQALEVSRRAAISQLKGVYEGYRRFCESARVEPETLLRVWVAPTLEGIQKARDLLDSDIPAHEEIATCVYETLCGTWPGLRATGEAPRGNGEPPEGG